MSNTKAMRFDRQFVPKILAGQKLHAFRLKPVPVGTVLHMESEGDLFATATVETCEPCTIREYYDEGHHRTDIHAGGYKLSPRRFAEVDGFPTVAALLEFLASAYPHCHGTYEGHLITWGDLTPLQLVTETP
jgi:hypothetical protein